MQDVAMEFGERSGVRVVLSIRVREGKDVWRGWREPRRGVAEAPKKLAFTAANIEHLRTQPRCRLS